MRIVSVLSYRLIVLFSVFSAKNLLAGSIERRASLSYYVIHQLYLKLMFCIFTMTSITADIVALYSVYTSEICV